MKIDSIHPEYQDMQQSWEICRDCFAGELEIKKKRGKYLPRLESQSDEGYRMYIERAVYYTVLSSTIMGRIGQVMRKQPIITDAEGLEDWIKEITLDSQNIYLFTTKVLEEIMKTGRVGILVDYTYDKPYLSLYFAEDIVSWYNSNNELIDVLLRERTYIMNDAGEVETHEMTRHLYMDEYGQYKVSLYNTHLGSIELIEDFEPTSNGKPLDFIPFVFINTNSMSPSVEKPPLLDVALTSLAVYRNSADLEQILHTLAVPTPYGTGLEEDDIEGDFVVGPSEFKQIRSPDAKLGMLEFSGAGVDALKVAIEDKTHYISSIGGSIYYSSSKQVEQAETARLRLAAETASTSSIVNNVESAINRIFEYAARWAKFSNTPKIKINRDFLDAQYSPEMLKAINEAEVMGLVSSEAAFNMRNKMEIYPDHWTFDKEQDLLEDQKIPAKVTTSVAGSISLSNNPNNQTDGEQ